MNESGTVVNTYEYTPWGEIRNETETVDNPIKYAGEYYDDELDMIYLRARMYDTSTGRFINEDPIRDGLNCYMYCGGNPIFYIDSTGMAKDGDERFSQSVRDEIAIYGQVWSDAETAYSLGIIGYYEKISVQSNAESRADEIRYRADHPFKAFSSDAIEFAVFDILLGDLSGGTVYAADLSGPALGKMYGDMTNIEAIVKASSVAVASAVGSSDKGRTLVNTKINGKMTRVDIEFPQGGKPANLHVQIKGKGAQKVMINSMDDLAKLPKSVAKNSVIKEAVKKGLKMLGKLF